MVTVSGICHSRFWPYSYPCCRSLETDGAYRVSASMSRGDFYVERI